MTKNWLAINTTLLQRVNIDCGAERRERGVAFKEMGGDLAIEAMSKHARILGKTSFQAEKKINGRGFTGKEAGIR